MADTKRDVHGRRLFLATHKHLAPRLQPNRRHATASSLCLRRSQTRSEGKGSTVPIQPTQVQRLPVRPVHRGNSGDGRIRCNIHLLTLLPSRKRTISHPERHHLLTLRHRRVRVRTGRRTSLQPLWSQKNSHSWNGNRDRSTVRTIPGNRRLHSTILLLSSPSHLRGRVRYVAPPDHQHCSDQRALPKSRRRLSSE